MWGSEGSATRGRHASAAELVRGTRAADEPTVVGPDCRPDPRRIMQAGLSVRLRYRTPTAWSHGRHCAGNIVDLVLSRSYAMTRGLEAPFCGADSSSAFGLPLVAWALQEADGPTGGPQHVRFRLGTRIQDVTRAA